MLRKIIKTIIAIFILGYGILYMCFYGIPWMTTNYECRKYIRENYPNANIKNIEYEQQVAFILFGGKAEALVEEDGYEFIVEASNLFISKASVTDYYGSSSYEFYNYEFNDNELFEKVVKYMSNHEIFKKYQLDESQVSIVLNDESSFVTKEKADKNTFEIINIDIKTKFLSDEVDCVNIITSEEKHNFMKDIDKFLKSENIKFHQLGLSFSFDSIDEESYYVPDVRESIIIYSNEFLKYKDEEYSIENHLNDSNLNNLLENLNIEGWDIKENPITNKREICFIIENNENSEVLRENIKEFFININKLLIEEYRRTGIKLILEDKNHEENVLHFIEYNR